MSAEFAYAQWPWGTGSKDEFIVSCRDLAEVGFEYFESVKAFIDTFKDDIGEFKAITREYNVRPISFYFHLSDNYEFDIADLKEKIGFVAANDIKTISVQGKWSPEPATQADLEYTTKTIIEYGKICRQYGVLPCVHPHHNTSIMYENEIDYVMAHTDPDEIAFGPDTAHLAAGGCDPVAIFERYKNRIRFTHLKDLKGALKSGGMQAGVEVYSNFRELGEGDINFKSIFDVLKSVDYQGYLCGELDRSRYTNKESAIITMKYLCENW